MKYVIDPKNRPVYLQLYKQLRQDIIAGNYPCNTNLPSKRSLAAETGVSIIAVEHAYELLCEEGYAEARQRSGYVVIFRKTDGFVNPEPLHTQLPEAAWSMPAGRHRNLYFRRRRKCKRVPSPTS